ncbi:16S rRNA (guanine(527)-N(7))-methyltransferase GidB [Streptococcus infantis SK970]|nr:16S rRNA (guanine(527)-N(7))-methyltransferase GidB [Streptococcus infantis SK970]
MKPETFYSLLDQQNINLTDQQKFQFERYFELLVEWNQKINLTAITEKEEVYLKHFYDSIAPILQGLIENQEIKLLDIGAGAGFPSLPMKILYPQLDVTIIDSLNKRINFLQLLAEELDLEGVHFYHGRAEDFAQDNNFRAQFDIVTARAVARMQVLSELTIPYLKVGGKLLALKASNAPEELTEAKNALNLLFSKVEDNISYTLPNGDPRYITIVEKKKKLQTNIHVRLVCQINAHFRIF